MDIKNVLKVWQKDMKPERFVHTNYVIDEALRFNPPVTFTDTFTVQKDCKAGNINFK